MIKATSTGSSEKLQALVEIEGKASVVLKELLSIVTAMYGILLETFDEDEAMSILKSIMEDGMDRGKESALKKANEKEKS